MVTGRLRRLLGYSFPVPWCVPQWGCREFWETLRCPIGGGIVRGPLIAQFTDEMRRLLDVKHVLPVNRARSAVELVLRAMRLGPEDEVVLPTYLCRSVLNAVERAGARPVFADIGPDLQVTPQTVEAAVSPKTRCIIVAHLFGNAAPIDAIERFAASRNIALIDDAAQSFGARLAGRMVGTFGDFGVVSCGHSKPLAGAAGGVLVTNNAEVFQRAVSLALPAESAGRTLRRLFSFWMQYRLRRFTLPFFVLRDRFFPQVEESDGLCKMSNVDAAIGLVQLRRLGEMADTRRRNAQEILGGLGLYSQFNIVDISADAMAVRVVLVLPPDGPDAAELRRVLRSEGIESLRAYRPLHLDDPSLQGALPASESLWNRVVCIPTQTRLKNAGKLARRLKSAL
jgi:perosamine synthetase